MLTLKRLGQFVATTVRELLKCPSCEYHKQRSDDLIASYEDVVGLLKLQIGNLENQSEAKDATIAYYRELLHKQVGLHNERGTQLPDTEQVKLRGARSIIRDMPAIQKIAMQKNKARNDSVASNIKDMEAHWRQKNAEADAKEEAFRKSQHHPAQDVEVLEESNG